MPLFHSLLLLVDHHSELLLLSSLLVAVASLVTALVCRLPDCVAAVRAVGAERAAGLEGGGASGAWPKVSIVVPTFNSEEQLSENLPRVLTQNYAGTFEVIVADQHSDDDTSTLVQRLQTQFSNLRFTFVPASARHIERRKLAITLGVRAARSEWVIVLNPESYPMSNTWLSNFAVHLTADADFVAAYVNYDADHTASTRRASFERLSVQMMRMRALHRGCVAGCETSNYAMRKSWFMQHSGFADSLCLPFGEECIMACRRAAAGRTRFLLSERTRLCEEAPAAGYLQTLRICSQETLRHLPRRVRAWAFVCRLGICASHLCFWSLVVMAATLACVTHDVESVSPSHWAMAAAGLTVLFAGLTLPPTLLHRATKAMGETSFSRTLFTHALLFPFRSAVTAVKRRSRQREFVRRFL